MRLGDRGGTVTVAVTLTAAGVGVAIAVLAHFDNLQGQRGFVTHKVGMRKDTAFVGNTGKAIRIQLTNERSELEARKVQGHHHTDELGAVQNAESKAVFGPANDLAQLLRTGSTGSFNLGQHAMKQGRETCGGLRGHGHGDK